MDLPLQLALFLVAERAKGADSEWAGYLASLPDQPESPLFWTPDQMVLLDGTQLQQSVEGYRCALKLVPPLLALPASAGQQPAAAARLGAPDRNLPLYLPKVKAAAETPRHEAELDNFCVPRSPAKPILS